MSESDKKPLTAPSTASRLKLRARWVKIALVVLLVVVLAVLGGTLAFLRTEAGLTTLARLIEHGARTPKTELRIGKLTGTFPEHLRLEDVTFSDAAGTIVELDRLELRWHPLALFDRHLRVSLLDIGTLTINRLPPAEAQPEEPETPSTGLPSLPVDVTVERFRLDALDLPPELAGQAVRLTAAAELGATRGGEFSTQARIETLSGPATGVSLDADYEALTDRLKIHIDLEEARGGLIGALIGLPSPRPLSLEASGEGPMRDWQGRLQGRAGDAVGIDLTVRLNGREPLRVSVTGGAEVAGFLPADQQPLVRGGLMISAAATIDDKQIELGEARISATAGSVRAQGTFIKESGTVDAAATVVPGEPAVFASLAPGLTYSSAVLDVHATGALPMPTVQARLLAEDLAMEAFRAGAVELQIRASPADGMPQAGSAPPVDLNASLEVRTIVPPSEEWQALVEKPWLVTLDGQYDPSRSHALVRSLHAKVGPVDLTGSADASLREQPSGTAEIETNAFALAPLGPLLGVPVTGKGRVHGRLSAAEDGRFEVVLKAGAEEFSSQARELAALLGSHPTLRANAGGDHNATIVMDADVRAAQFHATAEARAASDFTSVEKARLRINAEDLRGLEPIINAPISGRFTVEAEASGPVESLTGHVRAVGSDIVFADERVSRLGLGIDAHAIPGGTRGTLALDAATSLGDLAAKSGFAMENAARRLRVDRFELDYANGLSAMADLTIPLDGQPAAGTISVRSPDLIPVGRGVGLDLAGRLDLDIALSDVCGSQQASADLRVADLALGSSQARPIEIRAVHADVQLLDPKVRRELTASVDADGISAAGGQLARTTVRADGRDGRYTVKARSEGDMHGLTQLDLDSDIRQGERTIVGLRRLDAQLHGETLSLEQTAQIEVGDERLRIDDLALAYGRARATLSLLKSRDQLRGQFHLSDVDLALLEKFRPGLGAQGVVGADARLSGTPAAPALSVDLKADQLEMTGRTRHAPRSQTPTVTARMAATIQSGRAKGELSARGLGDEPFEVTFSAPVRFTVEPFAFDVDETGPLRSTVRWHGKIDPLMQMLPIDAILLSGIADVDLAVRGTVQRPLVDGEVSLSQGNLEVFSTGTLLRPLDVKVEGHGDELRLTAFRAQDGGNGAISGTGTVELSQPTRIDLRIDLVDFTAVRRDDVVSQLGGTLSAVGAIGEKLDVAARIENRHTEVRLINRLPPSVVTVPVTFVNEKAEPAPAAEGPAAPTDLGWIILDMNLELPSRVFVRGRGLDSEWAGSLSVTGTADEPQVRGSLKPVRGQFDLLGKRFALTDGKINIDGLDQDIALDLTATYESSDLTARLIVSGTATQPKIALESDPELPQDEILARVLFDKSSGQLTAAEAAQISVAAATLASGEPGVLDKLRTATGLDRLTIGSAPEGDDSVGTVEAGKNIFDGVYVGAEQGSTAASTSAVVEIDVTKNIKLRSSTSSEGSNRVGLRWEWDY